MRWLLTMVRAIGRVVGITHPVGHVPQTQDSLTGGNNNTAELQPLQPVSPESKPKRSRAKQGTQAQSAKAETSRAPTRTKKSSAVGTQPATPVRQPAQSKPNSKRSPVKQDTAAQSRSKDKQPAQAECGVAGKQLGTRANQSSQQKPAPKAAKSTTAVKSRKQGQSQPAKRVRGSQPATPARKTRQHAK